MKFGFCRGFFIYISVFLSLGVNNVKALLAPASFSEMYNVASKGYHSVLQRAIDRGLNIDSLDRNGNTGLCVAILRRDCRAYNSFATVGANRNHYCVSRIPRAQYEEFMNSGCIAPFLFGEKPMVAEENSRKLALFWIFIGVAAVTGAVIALSSGGGSSSTEDSSGGGSGGSGDDDDDDDTPGGSGDDDDDDDTPGGGDDDDTPGGGDDDDDDDDDDVPYDPENPGNDQDEIGKYDPTQDLASQSGTLTPAEGKPLTDGKYEPIMNFVTNKKTLSLEDEITVVNESLIEVKDEEGKTQKVLVSDAIDWSKNSILQDAGYLRAGGKAVGVSTVINGAVANMTVKDASVGLAATGRSTAENQGVLNVLAKNAAVGMAAGQNSKARNMGTLNLNLVESTLSKNQIIGMYADTNSQVINDTNIMGSAVDSTAGNMTGMQVNLVRVNKGDTKATNTGEINFNMGTEAKTGDTSVVITGMKSVYDKILDDATEPVLASAVLTNEGSIKLSNDTWKDAASLQLIGMSADKNTTVDNKGGSIEISSVSKSNSYAIRSDESGNISNSGSIMMNGYNDYGIYAKGGEDAMLIKNEGTLDFGSENSADGTVRGIYAEQGTMENAGAITIENISDIKIDKNESDIEKVAESDAEAIHGIGVEKISNDASLTIAAKNATGIILDNKDKDAGKLLFDGSLDIEETASAYGLKIINAELTGKADQEEGVEEKDKKGATGEINIKGRVKDPDDSSSYTGTAFGIYMDEKASGMNSGSLTFQNVGTVWGIYVDNTLSSEDRASSLHNKGDISITKVRDATGAYAKKYSRVVNDANIDIQEYSGSVTGMYADDYAYVENNGDISIGEGGSYRVGMGGLLWSEVWNKGNINIDADGYGISMGKPAYVYNYGSITLESGVGVSMGGGQFVNGKMTDEEGKELVGTITISADKARGFSGAGMIYNSGGSITVDGEDVYAVEAGMTSIVISDGGTLEATGKRACGFCSAMGYDADWNPVRGAFISSVDINASPEDDKPASIVVNASDNEDGDESYAILLNEYNTNPTEDFHVNNSGGIISITGNNVYGVKADNLSPEENGTPFNFYNSGKIEVSGKNLYGVILSNATEVTNDEDGEIILDNYGIGLKSDNGTDKTIVKNLGTIQILRGRTVGVVDIDSADFKPVAVGMDITSGKFEIGPAQVDDDGWKIANVLVNSDASRGVAVHGGATGVNKGVIEMAGDYNVGIYADETGSAGVLNQGEINISGNASIGMYADGNALMINDTDGVITVSGTNSVGMKARGAGATVENRGRIYINSVEDTDGSSLVGENGGTTISNPNTSPIVPDEETFSLMSVRAPVSLMSQAVVLEDGATFINSGEAIFDGDVNFNDAGTGTVMAAKDGSFVAASFKGDVTAAANITTGSNEEAYVSENSFVGENAGLNLRSASHMFGAALVENENGGLDIVMNRRNFGELTDNSSVASFLEKNYQENNRVDLFDVLKSASGAQGFNDKLANELGMNFFPNFAKENLDVMKSLGRSMNNSLLENTDDRAERVIAGTDNFYRDKKSSRGVVGYKNMTNSLYGIADKRYNGNWRYGIGASVSELDSDYDGGSDRKETIVQMFVPVLYNSSEYKLLSTLKAGYGFGSYKRTLGAHTYKADTENFYYGLTNEARKNIDAGSFAIQPTAEFNVQGVYIGDTKENNGINVQSANNLSVEAGLGLYAVKMYDFYNGDKLNLRAGATYYYEFGDPYANIEAGMTGMSGTYAFDGHKLRRSRAVAGIRADYLHDSLNLYLAANKYFETNSGYEINLGLEWRF